MYAALGRVALAWKVGTARFSRRIMAGVVSRDIFIPNGSLKYAAISDAVLTA